MNYQDFISEALKGESVNMAAKRLHIPQTTLSDYKRSVCLPSYSAALKLATAAGLELELDTVFNILANEEIRMKEAKKSAKATKATQTATPDLGAAPPA